MGLIPLEFATTIEQVFVFQAHVYLRVIASLELGL